MAPHSCEIRSRVGGIGWDAHAAKNMVIAAVRRWP